MTPTMFQALQARREVHHRYSCLYAGIVASTLINTHLPEGSTPVSPFDFGASQGASGDRERIKNNLVSMFAMMPSDAKPEFMEKLKARSIAKLKADGYHDAELIFSEVFRSWKDKQ